MNAFALRPEWHNQPARKLRLKDRQWGFAAVHAAEPRPEEPFRVANARERFENEARMAMRDWLML